MNKDKVHRIIKRLTEALATLEAEPDADDNEDYDEDEDTDYDPMDDLPPLPWTYHGTERVRLDMGRGEQPKFERSEVWTDANGEWVNFPLEAYRLRTYLEVQGNYDQASREAGKRFDEDCDGQHDEYERRRRGGPRDADGLGVADMAGGVGRGRRYRGARHPVHDLRVVLPLSGP